MRQRFANCLIELVGVRNNRKKNKGSFGGLTTKEGVAETCVNRHEKEGGGIK
jgi:hypothetical protein